jgi:hypothetical protein
VNELEQLVRRWIRDEIAKARNDERSDEARYITAAAFAERHSIAISTVREAIADGRLQPVKRLGRAVRIAENATIAPRVAPDQEARRQDRVARMLAKGGRR